MNTKIQNQINIIKDSVLQIIPAEAIYLFGSYAHGTPTADSDIDIFVVVPDNTTDLPELQADIRELLWHKKTVPFDLLIGHSSTFNRRKNSPTLEREIIRKGILLYEI